MISNLFVALIVVLLLATAAGVFYVIQNKISVSTPLQPTPNTPLTPVLTPPTPLTPLHPPILWPHMVLYGDKIKLKNKKASLFVGDCNIKDSRTDSCGSVLSTTTGSPAVFTVEGGDIGKPVKSGFFTLKNVKTGDTLHQCVEAVGSGWGEQCVPITYTSTNEKINFSFNSTDGSEFKYGNFGHITRDNNSSFRVTLCKENVQKKPCEYNVVFRAIYGDDWELWSLVKV